MKRTLTDIEQAPLPDGRRVLHFFDAAGKFQGPSYLPPEGSPEGDTVALSWLRAGLAVLEQRENAARAAVAERETEPAAAAA